MFHDLIRVVNQKHNMVADVDPPTQRLILNVATICFRMLRMLQLF
jgi:hypothetical protein